MLWVTLGLAGAAAAAYVYLVRERLGPVGAGLAFLRTVALLALLALLANAAVRRPGAAVPTTVALDASLSMRLNQVTWQRAVDSATALAGREGVVRRFGRTVTPLDSTPPADGRSLLAEVLRLAAARGGRATVLTDGELEDVTLLPAELRDRARLVVLPRVDRPGLAVTEIAVPERLLIGDSVPITVELTTWGTLPDSTGVLTVRRGERGLLRRTVPLPPPPGRARRTVTLPPGVLSAGPHVLAVAVHADGDAESRDDERLRPLVISDLPTAVLVASPLDWEARFLARELVDLVPGGVQAFGALGAGRWVDLRTQRRVRGDVVERALRGASMTIVRGDVPAADRARRLWRWPAGGSAAMSGDWYVLGEVPPSPLVGRLGGLPWDSLPPVRDVLRTDLAGWQPALKARLGRRGAERVVLAMRDSAGRRELVSQATGFWRWAFRGGAERELYRSMLAAGVEWLLDGTRGPGVAAVVADPVVPQGVPITFRWTAGRPPDSVTVELAGADSVLTRTLAFGPDGTGSVLAPPDVYRWRVRSDVDAAGVAVVETFSPEFVPRPVVTAGDTGPDVHVARVGLRELWWAFGVAVAAFLLEWAWRLRRGLP